jgi:hypothetical protein
MDSSHNFQSIRVINFINNLRLILLIDLERGPKGFTLCGQQTLRHKRTVSRLIQNRGWKLWTVILCLSLARRLPHRRACMIAPNVVSPSGRHHPLHHPAYERQLQLQWYDAQCSLRIDDRRRSGSCKIVALSAPSRILAWPCRGRS